ncbi:hypothetical protein RD792_004396 [Penstemon davidsonii]|uniref:Uncharacterized protein n=1 Tax=Penstemon davidsonii TaxID=160366 RepID=A0ABR0DHG0_9LAMI|nr:hypothetical protein RD792_004396 [Penstemon davidsonii]
MSSCGSYHVPMCSTQSAWTHGYSQAERALSAERIVAEAMMTIMTAIDDDEDVEFEVDDMVSNYYSGGRTVKPPSLTGGVKEVEPISRERRIQRIIFSERGSY